MKYIIFMIMALVTISLFVKDNTIENFQSGSEPEITTEALSDLLTEININNNLVNSNRPINFEDLNINSISNELLNKFGDQLDLEVSKIDTSDLEESNKGGIYLQKFEKLEKDIAKLKLIKEELKRRRLQRRNQYHLKTVKDKIERIDKYDDNDKLAIYSSCPSNPFAYNDLSIENQKFNIDLSRHPIKWYGLDGPELQNKLPFNFVIH